jgi:hypothetical protein
MNISFLGLESKLFLEKVKILIFKKIAHNDSKSLSGEFLKNKQEYDKAHLYYFYAFTVFSSLVLARSSFFRKNFYNLSFYIFIRINDFLVNLINIKIS